MSDLKLHPKDRYPKGVDHDGVLKGLDRFDITPAGRDALTAEELVPNGSNFGGIAPACTCEETGRDDCPLHGPNSDAALDAAIAGNASMFAELNMQLTTKSELVHELTAQVREWRRAWDGLTKERDGLVSAHAELIEEKLRLEIRLQRLTENGVPAPATLDEAIEQLFDAEAVLVAAEREVLIGRRMKFDTQIERDRDEQAALERVMAALTIKKTEAKDRLEEDERYAGLAQAYRTASRDCDTAESELRIATSRVETLRTCVHALSHRSPLTLAAARVRATRAQ